MIKKNIAEKTWDTLLQIKVLVLIPNKENVVLKILSLKLQLQKIKKDHHENENRVVSHFRESLPSM